MFVVRNYAGYHGCEAGIKNHKLLWCVSGVSMATTVAASVRQRPYWSALSPRCMRYSLSGSSYSDPHSEPWQPGALFGRAQSILLSVLELALHRAKHCSNLWPVALKQRRRGRRKPFKYCSHSSGFCLQVPACLII